MFLRLLVLMFLMSISVGFTTESIPVEYLMGDWEVTEIQDLKTHSVQKLRAALYFQFASANVCIVTNTAERRRVAWSWELQNDQLSLIQLELNQRKQGRVSFFKGKDGKILRKFQYTYTVFQKRKLRSGKITQVESGPFRIILES